MLKQKEKKIGKHNETQKRKRREDDGKKIVY